MKFFAFTPFLMNEAGDGGAGGGGDTALTVSTGTAVADTGAGGDGTGTDLVPAGDNTPASTGADSQPIFERGQLSKSASQTFRTLETANPTARRVLGQAQRALATQARLVHQFGPKPFDRINALLKFEKEVGGVQGLQALRDASAELDEADSLYERADPKLIQDMTETPAAKQAFVGLWPHSVARFREIAPKTYTRWLGAQVMHSLEKIPIQLHDKNGSPMGNPEVIDMPFRLRRMFGNLPGKFENGAFTGGDMSAGMVQEFYSDLAFIWAMVNEVRGWSQAQPEDLTPPKEDTSAARIAELESQANNATQEAWAVQRNAVCNEVLEQEIRKQTKGMELASVDMLNVAAEARNRINRTRRQQPDNNGKVDAFFKAKDLKGYISYNKRIFEDNAQAAVEAAVQKYGKKAPARRGAQQTQQQTETKSTNNGQQQTQTQQTAPTQVVRLSAQEAQDLGGPASTRWMKAAMTPAETSEARKMTSMGQMRLRKGNPLKLPEGTVVQFPRT